MKIAKLLVAQNEYKKKSRAFDLYRTEKNASSAREIFILLVLSYEDAAKSSVLFILCVLRVLFVLFILYRKERMKKKFCDMMFYHNYPQTVN
jgi:hypothetical protein